MAFPGDPEGCPGKDEVAGYLEAYAQRFDLPVITRSPVISVGRDLSGGFSIETGSMELSSRQDVVATAASPARASRPSLRAPIHHQGITDGPGLAFLGLPWQRSRGVRSRRVGRAGRRAAGGPPRRPAAQHAAVGRRGRIG
jgi:hypothetical protein